MFNKFLDPKNDIAFKKIFGTEKNSDVLIHFLNDILKFKEKKPIQKVTFLPTMQDPDIASKKTSIVDILCEDADKNTYIVEMQVAKTKGFEKRAQYYAAKAYTSKANIGDAYEDLKEIIFVAIADYVMFPEKASYKSDHVILDKDTFEQDLKDFSFTFIELPKFHKEAGELVTLQEKWCFFFKHAEDTEPGELKKIIGSDAILQKAYDALNSYYWTQEELLKYEQSEKNRKDELAVLAQKHHEGKEEGRVEGREEGRAEGIAEGIQKGIAEGIQKGKKQAVIAGIKKRLERGHPIQEISEDTGFSIQEIGNIRDKCD